MMMPQAAASARSTAPSDLIGHLPTFPPTRDSSLTATSKLVTDDAASDSRSHVVTSPPEIQTMRDAGEYVVLFDDTSSDEE